LSSIAAADLAQVDGFIALWWADAETAPSEATAVVDFFLAGGDLILLQDNSTHDAIGEQLGIPTATASDGSVSNGGVPLFDGPFGSAVDVAQSGIIGQLSATDVSSNGGTVGATNASGQITAAYWNRGDYAAGAGRLLIVSDTDMWATTTATYAPLNDNGIFALNSTRFVPEPSLLLLQAAGLGVLGLLAWRRRRCRRASRGARPSARRDADFPKHAAKEAKQAVQAVHRKTSIEPGSPWENGYVESFNGKLRDECLNGEVFETLLEAQVLVERWRHEYNTFRPHSSLGYRPPAPEARMLTPNLRKIA
jgi:hypothetical protein